MIALRLILVLAALAFGSCAAAQGMLGVLGTQSDDSAGSEASAEGTSASAASTAALIELLKDDAAREALIAQLEAASSGPERTIQAAPEDAEPRTLGRRVSLFVSQVADEANWRAKRLWYQVQRLPGRADNFIDALDVSILAAAAQALGFVVMTTYGSYFLMRVLMRRITRRLALAAQGRGVLYRGALNLASTVLDAAIVAAAVLIATVLAITHYGTEEHALGTLQATYLTAFYAVGWSLVVVRAVLAPRSEQLRLIPIGSTPARQLWRWLVVSVALLGYGQLVAVPLVQQEAGYLPAVAVSSVLGGIVVIYALLFVWRHRRAVARWLVGDRDDPGGRILRGVFELWHVPVMAYLVFLFVIVILRPGNVLLPMLQTSAQVLALILVGLVMRNQLRRASARGIRMPATLRSVMPALERRVNSILPTIIVFLRLILATAVIGGTLTILGAIDPSAWFGDGSEDGLATELLTVSLIIAATAALWLLVASWIDYRLNPYAGKPPSAREMTLLTLLFNAMSIALVVITAMLVLSELGVNIAPLLASAGVLGLAIGFGAQKMVQDIITGIFIQFENAINVGDVVTVGGTTGVVEKLTVRSVSLRDLHGVFHIIPFSSVDMVSNYMRDFAYSVCDMGVAYREDIELSKQAMFDAFDELKQDPEQEVYILGELEWFGLNSFGDSAIVLRVRIKTLPGQQWGVGRAYNLILKRVFDERSIEIPFPHQTIYFGEDRTGNAPPIHIRSEPAETG